MIGLELVYNQLTKINNNTFSSLKNVNAVYLQNNNLTHIDAGMLNGLTKQRTLNLKANQIKIFEKNSPVALNSLNEACDATTFFH